MHCGLPFQRELSARHILIVAGLRIVLCLSSRFSSWLLALSILAVAAGSLAMVIGSCLYGHVVFSVVRPLLVLCFAVGSVVAHRYIDGRGIEQ